MSNNMLAKQFDKGRKVQCAITGLWLYESEMKKDRQGRLILPKVERNDHGSSQQVRGPGWERFHLI